MRGGALRFLAILAVLLGYASAGWLSKDDIPRPGTKECGKLGGENRRICDAGGYLGLEEMTQIDAALHAIENDIKHECGYSTTGFQVGIALIKRASTYGYTNTDSDIKKLAQKVHDAWGVGHEECNDGVLVLLSIADRKMYISGGKGVYPHHLSDDVMDVIIARAKPSLRAGDYPSAVGGITNDIHEVLQANGGPTSLDAEIAAVRSERRTGYIFASVFVTVIVLVFVGAVVIGLRDKRRIAREQTGWEACRARLLEIERLRDASEAQEAANSAAAPAPAPAAPAPAPAADTAPVPESDPGRDEDPQPLHAAPSAPPAEDAPLLPRAPQPSPPPAAGGGAGRTPPTPTFCPICLDDAGAVPTIGLPCGHRFHVPCVDEWMAGQDRRSCPVCRAVVYDADGTPLTAAEGHEAARQGRGGEARARRPTSRGPDGAPRPGPSGGPACAPAGEAAPLPHQQYHHYDHRSEYEFMLHRLHVRYPMYISRDMVREATRVTTYADGTTTVTTTRVGNMGGVTNQRVYLSAHPTFTRVEPRAVAAAAAARSAARSSSRRSGFGGGSSWGGGGRGGSW